MFTKRNHFLVRGVLVVVVLVAPVIAHIDLIGAKVVVTQI
jgi:hypothetical protein